MDNENTALDQENTQINQSLQKVENGQLVPMNPQQGPNAPKQKTSSWKKVTLAGVSGIALGSAATILTSAATAEQTGTPDYDPSVTGTVEMATSVNDDMSFDEAFAAARNEVGPGGVFIWHGNLYGTYTAEEWDNLTPVQQDDFANGASVYYGDVPAYEDPHTATTDDEIAVVNIEDDPDDILVDPIDVTDPTEPDVELYGVIHDPEYDVNIGEMTIDGQDIVLIDVDDDNTFDIAMADINGDNQISDDEIIDIHSSDITVDDLGGFVDADSDLNTDTNPDIDYTNDGSDYLLG